ncbi:unnamed protein product [Protopolystoma xenopodis]|uniref:Uncharacterized protein n=1 Tax=Protopolystoma xenopodis TaxID=117903 RepID=A0A448WLZ7_9PLAT|nr:unnamed protein product [Protopolystoma xenopodis]
MVESSASSVQPSSADHVDADLIRSIESSQVNLEAAGKTLYGVPVPVKVASRAHLIHCHGLAVKRAYVNRTNQFTVDASSAGALIDL